MSLVETLARLSCLKKYIRLDAFIGMPLYYGKGNKKCNLWVLTTSNAVLIQNVYSEHS